MTALCRECDRPIYDTVMQAIAAQKNMGLITEYSGTDICNGHRSALENVVHSFADMPDGEIIIINEATADFAENGRLPLTHKTSRTKTLGYLSVEEAQRFLPKTYECLSSEVLQESGSR